MKKPELLAPAGDLERLKIAIDYGADAVYVGGPAFGLRANANNFTFEDLEEGCLYAHSRGKKVYVTANIVLHDKEVKELLDYLKRLEQIKVDAIIVSDPTVIDVASKNTNLEIHLSTQQSTMNVESVNFFKSLGVTRIVLARECSEAEIKEIIDNCDIEIECFIHGSMCASISGRCVLSNFLTARDANRGGCSQICRWDFDLYKDNEKIETPNPFTLCTKDLSLIEYIPNMMDIGITSFKIEGRMRSIYYIATIVDIYRHVIDDKYHNKENYTYNSSYKKILDNCANRESIAQFYNNQYDENCQYYLGRQEISNQDFLGLILDYNEETKIATVQQRNYFKKYDTVEIFGPKTKPTTYTIIDIKDADNNLIDVVRHPLQVVTMKIDFLVSKNDFIRVKR